MKTVEFFSLCKLIQGRVIVNLGIEGREDVLESMAVEMNWMTKEQIEKNIENVENQLLKDDPRGFTKDNLKTYTLVAETLSQHSGWFYVGIFTLNPDRTFLGLHDLKTIPQLVKGTFNVLS